MRLRICGFELASISIDFTFNIVLKGHGILVLIFRKIVHLVLIFLHLLSTQNLWIEMAPVVVIGRLVVHRLESFVHIWRRLIWTF